MSCWYSPGFQLCIKCPQTDEWHTHTSHVQRQSPSDRHTYTPQTHKVSQTHIVGPQSSDVPAGLSASCALLSWRHCWRGCDRSGLCWSSEVQCLPVATSYCHRHRSSQWPEPGKYLTHCKREMARQEETKLIYSSVGGRKWGSHSEHS